MGIGGPEGMLFTVSCLSPATSHLPAPAGGPRQLH